MIGRRIIYSIVLVGFYTFIVIFGIRTGFMGMLVPMAIINTLSFLWFFFSASKVGYMIANRKDFILYTFIYFFVNFFTISASIIFSRMGFDLVRLILLGSPMMVWIAIWVDFYFQRMRGML